MNILIRWPAGATSLTPLRCDGQPVETIRKTGRHHPCPRPSRRGDSARFRSDRVRDAIHLGERRTDDLGLGPDEPSMCLRVRPCSGRLEDRRCLYPAGSDQQTNRNHADSELAVKPIDRPARWDSAFPHTTNRIPFWKGSDASSGNCALQRHGFRSFNRNRFPSAQPPWALLHLDCPRWPLGRRPRNGWMQ